MPEILRRASLVCSQPFVENNSELPSATECNLLLFLYFTMSHHNLFIDYSEIDSHLRKSSSFPGRVMHLKSHPMGLNFPHLVSLQPQSSGRNNILNLCTKWTSARVLRHSLRRKSIFFLFV